MTRKTGKTARRRTGTTALPKSVKLTVRVSVELAQRLGVEASMRRVSQSSIVEEVLGPYLSRWRLPSTIEQTAPDHAGPASDAA